MSLLPSQIIPASNPLGVVQEDGKTVMIDKNWWLFLYNLFLNSNPGSSDPETLFLSQALTLPDPQSSKSGGMTNPMTTTGDIIYSSDNSGTPARLGIGSSGQLLNVSSGIPAWTTPSNSPMMLTITASGPVTIPPGYSTATILCIGMGGNGGASVGGLGHGASGSQGGSTSMIFPAEMLPETIYAFITGPEPYSTTYSQKFGTYLSIANDSSYTPANTLLMAFAGMNGSSSAPIASPAASPVATYMKLAAMGLVGTLMANSGQPGIGSQQTSIPVVPFNAFGSCGSPGAFYNNPSYAQSPPIAWYQSNPNVPNIPGSSAFGGPGNNGIVNRIPGAFTPGGGTGGSGAASATGAGGQGGSGAYGCGGGGAGSNGSSYAGPQVNGGSGGGGIIFIGLS